MAKIVLEKLVKDNPSALPEFYKNLDKETFGIDWKSKIRIMPGHLPFIFDTFLNAIDN